jgi:hypothetical protein
LQEYLNKSLSKQIEGIYAMQVYASSKGFPKYFLAHLFNQMYDLEIIEEEAFFRWKDEINENYPNKGQALFYVRTIFRLVLNATKIFNKKNLFVFESFSDGSIGLKKRQKNRANQKKKNLATKLIILQSWT